MRGIRAIGSQGRDQVLGLGFQKELLLDPRGLEKTHCVGDPRQSSGW